MAEAVRALASGSEELLCTAAGENGLTTARRAVGAIRSRAMPSPGRPRRAEHQRGRQTEAVVHLPDAAVTLKATKILHASQT